MTRSNVRPLHFAIVAALAFAIVLPSTASAGPQDSEQLSMKEKRAKRLAEIRGDSAKDKKSDQAAVVEKPALYPNASRIAPEARGSVKTMKQLQALQELYEKSEMAAVIVKAEEIAVMPTANSYDKSYVYSTAASAAADLDDQAKAADYFRKAVDSNGLDNDSHFNTMFNLAVIQYQMEKYADALATMDTFLAETKSQKPEHLTFRAGLLANLERHEEAAAIYKSLIANNPNDKRILMNAVAALQGADKFEEANVLLEDAYKRGLLTEGKELRALYVGYMNASRWKDARDVMVAGTSKGILEAGAPLAKDYMVLAQNAYAEDNIPMAIEMYSLAAPMAADGEAYLNLAKVLEYGGKKADAKAAAQKGLDKGLKKPEEAKRILSL